MSAHPIYDQQSFISGLSEAEWGWLMTFVYDHSDGHAEGTYEPYTEGERYYCLLTGVSQAEADQTLASYRSADDPVWVDWAIRNLPEATR